MAKRIRPLLRAERPRYPTLTAYLKGTGDTQAHIARLTGVSQAAISRIVSGDEIPRPLLAAKIADYCNVPLDSFQRVYLAKQLLGRTVA
jgi:transcriptional regulator with XRE-family HTH domain